jgi:hypothetical protein
MLRDDIFDNGRRGAIPRTIAILAGTTAVSLRLMSDRKGPYSTANVQSPVTYITFDGL